MAGSVGRSAIGLKFNLATVYFSSHNSGLQTDEAVPINEVTGWRRAALWLFVLLLRVWWRTLRFEADRETVLLLTQYNEAAAIVLWHNRLFLTPEIFRRYRQHRRIYALVSASKDGAWLAALYQMIGIYPVRGSSSNYGREAASMLIQKIRAGHDIGITPDGPRGPIYVVEPGVLVVARRSNAPMILLGATFGRAFRLRSWDRFYLPWPFTQIKMHCTIVLPKNVEGQKLSADELRAALLAINPDLPET